MPVDVVIIGGKLVSPDGIIEGDLAIDGGIIVAVGSMRGLPAGRETIDAAGLHVLPGAIDVHVHFRQPGFDRKETWASGTVAAAVGGVTTVFDMPNTDPPTATVEAVREKIAIASSQAIVDFGVYGLIGEHTLDKLEAMLDAGAVAHKLYMGSENPLVPCPPDGAILEAFETLARRGVRTTVHAENTPVLQWRGHKLMASGRMDAAAHLEQHTDVATIEAVSRTAIFAEWTGAAVHIAHESSRHSLPHIRFAKQRGVDLTVETCPHYLFLSTDDGRRVGENFMRVKPPVREPGHAAPLWDALLDGTIDMISTDHAPHLFSEKRRPSIWDCAPGFPGVETSMRLMLTEVARGRMELTDYVRMACAAPAKAFGLWPRKGSLAIGTDADIVLIDTARRARISAEALHSLGNASPFDGFDTIGLAVLTMVRGRTVARDGMPVADSKAWGRSVTASAG